MKLGRVFGLLGVAALMICGSANALTIGDQAPDIKVSKWVKGDAVPSFEPGKMYVMEFWATWCGPCKATIPHLTEMSHKYKDVTFIGTSVWENDQSKVEPFVQEMGDKMDYHVAMDDLSGGGKGAMAENWMSAAQQNGIPTAFVVGKDSKVLWIGHPMQMEAVLKEIQAGTYKLEDAKAKMVKEQEKQALMEKLGPELNEALRSPMQAKDYVGALKALDEITAKHPEAASELAGVKMNIAAQGKLWDAYYEGFDAAVRAANDDAQTLNEIVWTAVSSPRVANKDYARLVKAAERASELTKNEDPQILDTLAHTYSGKGDSAKAIATEEKAIGLASDPELKKELEKNLAKFKAAK